MINENTAPQATDPYAQTHLAAEKIVRSANRAGKIEGLSLRSANGFGAPMTKDAIAGRIRRLLAMADKRARELGVPDTEASISPDLLN